MIGPIAAAGIAQGILDGLRTIPRWILARDRTSGGMLIASLEIQFLRPLEYKTRV
jgi:hypothetical protein